MGNERQYLKDGGFTSYLYETHAGFQPAVINGLKCKVLHYIEDGDTDHTGLPTYANSSDMYFRVGKDGTVIQGKRYIDRRHCIDFDWSHPHINTDGNGMRFPKGVVHVQIHRFDNEGKPIRLSNMARYMTDAEIAKYGPAILHFNPNVKFRP